MKVIFKHKMGGREELMHLRYAEVLQRLGRGTYMTRDMRAEQRRTDEELTELRAQYQDVVGKRPYHGWGAEELRERIAAAADAQS